MSATDNTKIAKKKKSSLNQTSFLPPRTEPTKLQNRQKWLDAVTAGFASNSCSNKEIYRTILETVWPEGHGIPGPIVSPDEIRAAVDKMKGRPYKDVFRRVRELQGDEGILGLIKVGSKYQLIDLNVSPKKQPRRSLSAAEWEAVLEAYHGRCACCGSLPGEVGFQPDHKVPRLRGGTDDLTNFQPLCDSCNNIKSAQCRGCTERCTQCGWAHPEFYKPVKLQASVLQKLNSYADSIQEDASELASSWIEEKLEYYSIQL